MFFSNEPLITFSLTFLNKKVLYVFVLKRSIQLSDRAFQVNEVRQRCDKFIDGIQSIKSEEF